MNAPRQVNGSTRRIAVLLLAAAPLLVWAGVKRAKWKGNDIVLQVRVEPLDSTRREPVRALMAGKPEDAWHGVIIDSPIAVNGSSGEKVHKETGERLMGPEWIWKRTSIQFRPSPSAAWTNRQLPQRVWAAPRDPSGQTWPLPPGQWKEVLEASFELYNESERVCWRGSTTHENIVTVTAASNRAFIAAEEISVRKNQLASGREDAQFEREEAARQREIAKQFAESDKRMHAHNAEIKRYQDRHRDLSQRVQRLQWRPWSDKSRNNEPWRKIPSPGERGFPITRESYAPIELRAVKVRPDRPWPTMYEEMYWEQHGEKLRGPDGAEDSIKVTVRGTVSPDRPAIKLKPSINRVTVTCNDHKVWTEVRFLPGPDNLEYDGHWDYLKTVEWKAAANGSWQPLPRSGSAAPPISAVVGKGIWLRTIPNLATYPVPKNKLNWILMSPLRGLVSSGSAGPKPFYIPFPHGKFVRGERFELALECGNSFKAPLVLKAAAPK